MAIASKLLAIGIIVGCMIVGLISFYIMSDLPNKIKKKHIEELFSQFINFTIFIWLGKILVNFSIFVKDPLAILAYPSNSNAFYLAVLFIAIVLVHKSKRRQMDVLPFIKSFLHVFLAGSFIYEFIQIVWGNNSFSFGYLVLLAILLVLFFSLNERITTNKLVMAILIGWSFGMLGLSLSQPFVTVFGYNMAPGFVGLFFIICILSLKLKQRKRDE